MEADIYVGLDASLDETSLCIVDQTGKAERESKVTTDPDAIQSALENWRNRIARIGVEASSIGIWLARELQRLGLPVIVVEARHMRSSLSAMRNKTDRNDTLGIAPRRSALARSIRPTLIRASRALRPSRLSLS